jgi:hypothetical protein
MPWRKWDSPISAAPEYEDYLFEQWSHGVFDDYWRQPGIYAEGFYDRYADVPIEHLSGWYDPNARTAMENYVGLSRAKRSRMQLILGAMDPMATARRAMPARLNLAPLLQSMATLPRISLNCAGAGPTAGSRGSPTASTRSRRCVSSSWAAARGGAIARPSRPWRTLAQAAEWPFPQTRWTLPWAPPAARYIEQQFPAF